MSQFRDPLDQFGRTRLPNGDVGSVVGPGVTEQLATPGLVVTPPVVQNTMAQQLIDVMRAGGLLGAHVEQSANQLDYIERKHSEKLAVADRGQAALDTAAWLPDVQKRILSGDLAKPSGTTDQEFIGSLIQEQIPEGMSQDYRSAFTLAATRELAPALARRSASLTQQFRQDQTVQQLASVSTAQSVEDLSAVAASLTAINPGMPEIAAKRSVGEAALRAATEASPETGRKLLSLASDYLGKDYQPQIDHATRQIETTERGVQAEMNQRAIEADAALQNAGVGIDARRALVASDSMLSEISRRSILESIDQQERVQIVRAQARGANLLSVAIQDQAWPGGTPEAALQHIAERSRLDPTDPNFISADHRASLTREMGVVLKQDADRAFGAGVFDQIDRTGTSDVPLTGTLLNTEAPVQLALRGIVSAVPQPNGDARIVRINDPVGLAKYASKIRGVPEQAVQLVQAGAASSDPAQAAEAITSYVALALKDEGLARESFNLKGNAKIRADYVLSRLRQNPVNAALDTNSLRDKVASGMDLAMSVNPDMMKVPMEQVLLAAVTGNDNGAVKAGDEKSTIRAGATTALKNAIFAPGSGLSEKHWYNGGNISFSGIPGDVLDTFERNLADEYRYQRSMNQDSASAAKAAQSAAASRTLERHPPTNWGGRLSFAPEGQSPFDAERLRGSAERALGRSVSSRLWNEYFPEEVRASDGTHYGWAFRSLDTPNGYMRLLGGDRVIVQDVAESPTAVVTRKAMENRARIEAMFSHGKTLGGEPAIMSLTQEQAAAALESLRASGKFTWPH